MLLSSPPPVQEEGVHHVERGSSCCKTQRRLKVYGSVDPTRPAYRVDQRHNAFIVRWLF